LDKNQTENLNKVRVSVAKIYAHKKRYADAITLLQQVPQNSKQSDKAKTLIRRYKVNKN
jgi:thioredoxin-like negative regulator of GroEL